MIHRILYRLTAHRPARLIKLDGAPYLERYYLGSLFGVTFYLHRFVAADGERHAHNHPWTWGRSLVLCGWYDEEAVIDLTPATLTGYVSEIRRVNWWNHINGNHFHRIAAAAPNTWTLFFHGPRAVLPGGALKGWGFIETGPPSDVVAFRQDPGKPYAWWYSAPLGYQSGREP